MVDWLAFSLMSSTPIKMQSALYLTTAKQCLLPACSANTEHSSQRDVETFDDAGAQTNKSNKDALILNSV